MNCRLFILLAIILGTPLLRGGDVDELLAQREKRRGPLFPGKDPAFLLNPRPAERTQTAGDLITAEVQEIRRKALDYLLANQAADGSWSEPDYPHNTGVTGLAALALISEGNMPRVGPHGKALDRAIEFLLKSARSNGIIAGEGSNKLGPMYEHSYATLALIYAYGNMPWQLGLQNTISLALQAILTNQHLDGGWRYQFSREGESDVGVTANVLWVLRAAKKSGFTVPAAQLTKAQEFMRKTAQPDDSFKYRLGGRPLSPSMGGACIIALTSAGKMADPLIAPALERIASDYRRYSTADLMARRYFIYNAFYASVAMYAGGDEYWTPWYAKTVSVLKTVQRRDGEFADEHGSLIYPTAMGLMILQAPYGLLPLYER